MAGGDTAWRSHRALASIWKMAIIWAFARESTKASGLPCGEKSGHNGASLMPDVVSAVIIALTEGEGGREEGRKGARMQERETRKRKTCSIQEEGRK